MNTYNEATYPIVEIFESVQGEGTHAGRWTTFIRLGGCNVGKPYKGQAIPHSDLFAIHTDHTVCTSAIGQQFMCDTNYKTKQLLKVEQILSRVNSPNVCITGGEPFIHNLVPLVFGLLESKHRISIETSGTKDMTNFFTGMNNEVGQVCQSIWITCSPKSGYYRPNSLLVDELKFVVVDKDSHLVIRQWMSNNGFGKDTVPVFIQPINEVDRLDNLSIQGAISILKNNPRWKLSLQMHKVLGME